VIDQALDLGTYLISFDGGEPMMRKDLPQMVAHVDKERAIATSFTSGYGLSEEMAHALKSAGMYAVRVSLDGADAIEHDRMRGRGGAFDDAITGIKNALSAEMLVDMFVVVSPANIDSLDEFYSLACDLGVHELSIYEIIAVGRWMDHEDEVITKNDVARLTNFQKRINRQPDGPRVTAFPYYGSRSLWLLCRQAVGACDIDRRCSAVCVYAAIVRKRAGRAAWRDLEADRKALCVQRICRLLHDAKPRVSEAIYPLDTGWCGDAAQGPVNRYL
jgi:MoaA/NifB/PqqE/SkfB family radical SAM enzyme